MASATTFSARGGLREQVAPRSARDGGIAALAASCSGSSCVCGRSPRGGRRRSVAHLLQGWNIHVFPVANVFRQGGTGKQSVAEVWRPVAPSVKPLCRQHARVTERDLPAERSAREPRRPRTVVDARDGFPARATDGPTGRGSLLAERAVADVVWF